MVDQIGENAGVSVRGLYKIFGEDTEAALTMAKSGASKQDVEQETGDVLAVADVSFDVKEGQIFVVMGLSGCGKSTLVRCLNLLVAPSEGEIWIGSHEVTSMDSDGLREARRSQVAMVFQHYGLMPHRTVLDNVAFGLELNGMDQEGRRLHALDAIRTVGLEGWEDRLTGELSGGMKQRVGLARALATDCPVLLMDEPFSALDPLIRRELQDQLMELQGAMHKTIIFITHDLSEAVRIGDSIAVMRDGRIVQIDEPAEVVLNPIDRFVRDFTREVRQHALMTAEMVMNPPDQVVRHDLMASEVIRNLIANQRSYARVVDEQGKYLGTALIERIEKVLIRGDLPISEAHLMIEDGARLDTVLDDLVPYGLRSERSVPVFDHDGVLLGQVLLEALAAAMESDVPIADQSDARAT